MKISYSLSLKQEATCTIQKHTNNWIVFSGGSYKGFAQDAMSPGDSRKGHESVGWGWGMVLMYTSLCTDVGNGDDAQKLSLHMHQLNIRVRHCQHSTWYCLNCPQP